MRAFALLTFLACSSPPTPPPVSPVVAVTPVAPRPPDPSRLGGFPLPPRQFTKASIDAALPPKFVSTVTVMFELGLADPRGCEYREIEVMTSSIWGGNGEVVKTHGWVLPGKHRDSTWVIGWNGAIYPAVSVGGAADLAADIAGLIKLERDAHAKSKAGQPDSSYHRFGTTAETYNLAHQSPTALKVALVAQLGHGALAKQLWDVVALDESLAKLDDPFLVFSVDWAWNLFERAVTAHMRGDTATALPSARLLAAAAPTIEAEADRRKIERRTGRDNQPGPHVSFITQLQLLIDDESRREALGKRTPVPDAKGLAALDPGARIKLLIDNLDQVAARQMGQPGGVDLASDPIVTALIDIGGPAVEPLIAVLESDVRLTRSVHFWRDFARNRSLLGVHEAAYVALAGIMEQPFFDPASTGDNLSARGADGRRAVADKVRAFWDKWKAVGLEDRWMMVLADDAAKPGDWIDAAAKITRPHNVQVRPSSTVFTTTVTNPNGKPGMRGDVLRSRTGPSVSDLMLKRLRDPKLPADLQCSLAVMFGEWDIVTAKPHVKARLAKVTAANPNQISQSRCVVALARELAQAGDLTAIDTYATWATTVQPSPDYYWSSVLFELMLDFPTRPSIKKAAESLFRDASPWVPLFGTQDRLSLVEGPLLKVAAFNRHVTTTLASMKIVGELEVGEGGRFSVKYANGGSMSTMTHDKDTPAKGTKHSLRLADMYAWHLANHKDAPKFALYWSEAKRDEAIKALAAWVPKQVAN